MKTEEIMGMTNAEILKEYPFVSLYDWHAEETCSDATWLDAVPIGWLKAFGKMMCDDVKQAAIQSGCLSELRTVDIKEKFGELRWDMSGTSDAVDMVLDTYLTLSGGVCMICGKPDVRITRGWITPICYSCWCKPRKGLVDEATFEANTSDGHMPDKMSWREYDPNADKWNVKEYDILNTANRIRAKWRVEHEV